MFVVVQFPFADFRSLTADNHGRTERPDWQSEETKGFVRGFGKIAPRNSSSLGLLGEQKFADMNNALVFPQLPSLHGIGVPAQSEICLWYRRLYFDGMMGGRFEIGFIVLDHDDKPGAPGIDCQQIASLFLSARIEVRSPDTSVTKMALGQGGAALATAYVIATTRHNKMIEFPPAETIGSLFFVGDPMAYIRVSSNLPVAPTRDKRLLSGEGEPPLFLTSAAHSGARGNVIVQTSSDDFWHESVSDRVVRVLTNHMLTVAFAYDRLLNAAPSLTNTVPREQLRRALANAIQRISAAEPSPGIKGDTDADAARAMVIYGRAFAGQIDRLADRLEELQVTWAKPTWSERAGAMFADVRDSVVKALVEVGFEKAGKGGAS